MAVVELEDAEWQAVITALAMSNPLVVKIATQLQRNQARAERRRQEPEMDIRGIRVPGNSSGEEAGTL